MNYLEILIEVNQPTLKELVIAELTELPLTGIEEEFKRLKVYFKEADLDENQLNFIINKYSLTYSKSIIKEKNWNADWESGFEPIIVENRVGVRANFHSALQNVDYEIVITPKMSFGTGHHPTTYLMLEMMYDLPFQKAKVYDFGTGTGILAIYAEMLGAQSIVASDYDHWCFENTAENIAINKCKKIDNQLFNGFYKKHPYQIILANINKNIILQYFEEMVTSLEAEGYLLLSGLLFGDEKHIHEKSKESSLVHLQTKRKGDWIAMLYKKC